MSRVPKTHPRIEAYGDGRRAQRPARRRARRSPACPSASAGWLRRIQNDLFDVGADLSVPRDHRARGRASACASLPEQIDVAGGALRRGQRELDAAASRSCCRAAPPPPRSCTCAARCAAAPSAARSLVDGRQPRDVALPQPALRPAVHPQPRRERRRRAALGAGALSLERPPGRTSQRSYRNGPAAKLTRCVPAPTQKPPPSGTWMSRVDLSDRPRRPFGLDFKRLPPSRPAGGRSSFWARRPRRGSHTRCSRASPVNTDRRRARARRASPPARARRRASAPRARRRSPRSPSPWDRGRCWR